MNPLSFKIPLFEGTFSTSAPLSGDSWLFETGDVILFETGDLIELQSA